MYLFYKFILVLTISSVPFYSALADENSMGLLSPKVNPAALSEVGQWDKMVGNWQVVSWRFDQDGQVTSEFKGEWNWSYILNGQAIQDVFIIPTRAEQLDANPAFFFGTNIRSFNNNKKKWDVAWINNRHGELQLWEAELVNDQMVMRANRPYMDEQIGKDVIRIITFYDMTDTHFKWKAEQSEDGGDTWYVSGKIEGTKVTK